MDDSKLLQESNFCVRQPRSVPFMLYISFNKHHRLLSEGLDNLSGITWARTQVRQLHAPRCYHCSTPYRCS